MFRKILLGLVLLLITAFVGVWFLGGKDVYELHRATASATALDDYALQDDSRVTLPTPEPYKVRDYRALKNVYWGDLHVHTVESFDAVLFGTTLTIEDAYRFAKGAPLRNAGGELMQLSRPLDFVAITDHAESFGLRSRCGNGNLTLAERFHCGLMETPNVLTFLMLQGMASSGESTQDKPGAAGVYHNTARKHPVLADWPICKLDEDNAQRCLRDAKQDWARYRALADQHNEPGRLTTFAAYEYSPPLSSAGKHHRNVIFNGDDLPQKATSYFDAGNAIDLWTTLENDCADDCDFLTIPHNMNKGWGLFYSPYTWDGKAYDEAGWRLRARREPLAEVYQVKGASECALGVGASDEECGFSQVLPPCRAGQSVGCAFRTSFARQGLKVGLQLEQELGFNPMAFGMIGSTDTHNANPGDAQEWDFVGKVAAASSPARRRLREFPDREPYESILQFHTSGGLAAVWAQENTRDALFAGMKRREAYATSGTRIALRFFAGWGISKSIVHEPDAIALATAGGVPMGAYLTAPVGEKNSPTFFAWASADPMSAPLQRIQIIKGWVDAHGETHEQVRDVSCSDGQAVDPTTARCPDNGATVDLETCTPEANSGAPQMTAAWTDPNYNPDQNAFYYVRVLQNPSCRWSTYDAIRLGEAPPAHVPSTLRERAWSSPIWLRASPASQSGLSGAQ